MRTQVAIVGAGPAGLLLSHLLHLEGIKSIVLEKRSRAYCEERVRAGVLEQGTVDLLNECGVGERMRRQGLAHHGIELRFKGHGHRIDLFELTGGRAITVYGQQEVVKDLIRARLEAGGQLFFEVAGICISELEGLRPRIEFRQEEVGHEIVCDFIAACDGSHGVCRPGAPAEAFTCYERTYPFAWLGILAEVAPSSKELIYASHERGFALHSMRSPRLTRLYLQCAPDEDLREWSDERIWNELRARFELEDGFELASGPILQRGVTTMRSYVVEPMRYGRMYLAGDAAHIVPPTGAKGMNLAVADVRRLARALGEYYRSGSEDLLNRYSADCLRRVWKAQHFSWWMTSMLHRFPQDNGFDYRRQMGELDYVTSSRAASRSLAENYAGLPLDD